MNTLQIQTRAHNARMLAKMNPVMSLKVAAILRDLEGKGLLPKIDGQVWRSPAQQAELKRKGFSKVSFSFHTCCTSKGEPDSLAADIVCAKTGWDAPKSFWLMLAASARAHGCETGIEWGLNKVQRALIETVLGQRNWSAKYVIGWDAAHVQPKGITLAQARAGRRPKQ